jgi:hypothetical protein
MGRRSEHAGRPHDSDAGADGGSEPGPPRSGRARPRPPVRMCVRCHMTTETPVVVCVVHQNSGPGFTVYACRVCASRFLPSDEQEVPIRSEGKR